MILGDFGNLEQVQDPQDFIPQKTDVVGWRAARAFLKRPIGSAPRVKPVAKTKGVVYWTSSGPKFSKDPVKGGAQAENVSAPEIIMKPRVSIVRDKPQIELPPILMPTADTFKGWGDWTPTKVGLPVLCLLIVGFLLYRR